MSALTMLQTHTVRTEVEFQSFLTLALDEGEPE